MRLRLAVARSANKDVDRNLWLQWMISVLSDYGKPDCNGMTIFNFEVWRIMMIIWWFIYKLYQEKSFTKIICASKITRVSFWYTLYVHMLDLLFRSKFLVIPEVMTVNLETGNISTKLNFRKCAFSLHRAYHAPSVSLWGTLRKHGQFIVSLLVGSE